MKEYVGFDVSKEETSFCVVDESGAIFAQGKLAGRVRLALEERPDLKAMIEPLLASAEALKTQIERLGEDVTLETKASKAARLLMTVPGVGPVTALAYAATIDDAGRFNPLYHRKRLRRQPCSRQRTKKRGSTGLD